jgi:RHS repeat-associated protein
VNGGITRFVYDEAGKLIGEYSQSGQLVMEYVWLYDTPVAVLTSGGTYYVNANHLNAPHVITNSSAQPVWTWDPLAFGDNPPTGSFTYNLRFPGQYYDAETGLHYNYYRDYNPALGRYVQSDPIGLDGGVNTYAYVGGNPVSVTDQNGNIAAGLFFLCAANPVCRAGMIGVGTFAIDVVYQGYENGIGKINYKEAIIAASINAGVSLFYPIVGVPTAPVLGPGIAKLAVKEIEFVNSMNEQQANAIRDALSRGGHPQASAAVNPNCAR